MSLEIDNPTDEQAFVHDHAEEICELSLQSAKNMMESLGQDKINSLTEEAVVTACVNDLELSGNRLVSNLCLDLFDFLNDYL